MSVVRTYSAIIHNHIANHPEVKPHIVMNGHDPANCAPLDLTECAARPEHYALLHNGTWAHDPDATGAMVFDWSGPGLWEQHTLFLPSCRGDKALTSAREMLRYMFTVEDAIVIWGQTPMTNRPARWFNRKLGGRSCGEIDHYNFGPCELFRLTRDQWEDNERERRAK